ncbi:hypothetical protein L195_g059888, partial [Trifolium pratense]
MENRIYTSNSPTNYISPTTRFYDPNTMFLAHYRRTAEAAAAASSIRYSSSLSDIDIAPPGVSSRISSSSTANFLSQTNPWANAFNNTAANVASASLQLKRSAD